MFNLLSKLLQQSNKNKFYEQIALKLLNVNSINNQCSMSILSCNFLVQLQNIKVKYYKFWYIIINVYN